MKGSQNFSDYELHLYGTGIGDSPQRIVFLGNNKELLGACILPKTGEQLNQLGITVTDKQVKLLQDWRLLKVQDGVMQTAVTILSKEKTHQLREHTRAIAPSMIDTTREDFNNFLQALSEKYTPQTYVLFFSYILDSLVWDYFIGKGLVKSWEVKDKKASWIGVLWGYYLQRPFSLGTNTYNQKAGEVISYTVWTRDLIPKLEPLFKNPKNILKIAEEYKVPLIQEQPGNPIYDNSLKLSQKLAEEVLKNLDLDALIKEYNFKDAEEALVVTYHELLWDIMEEMENRKLLTKPEVIANPKQAKEPDISGLIFLVSTPK